MTDPIRLKVWVALFAGATPLTIALFAPLWGRVADRHGRRLMLIRANACGAIVLTLMGMVANAPQLIFLRLLQGMFTGTVSAAQAMVASDSPDGNQSRTMGWLSAAVYTGSIAGAAAGGLCAHWLGYRMALTASGLILALSALLVWWGTKELEPASQNVSEPVADLPPSPATRHALHRAAPWLAGMLGIAFIRQLDSPFIPLLVQEIHGKLEGAALWTGLLNASSGVAGLLAGLTLGALTDRMSPTRLMAVAGILAAMAATGQALTHAMAPLFIFRFGILFCAAALEPVLQAWLAHGTPHARRGVMFGFAASARSIGWFTSAGAGGVLSNIMGIRGLFAASAAGYLVLAWALPRAIRRRQSAGTA